jgi:hypothetical protein
MSHALAFWLIPTRETRGWFEDQIRALADRFDAPIFEPHLTVHVGPEDTVASPESLLAESALECAPITLTPSGVGHSDVFTKTLYVEFPLTSALANLSSKLCERLPSDYTLSPHVSLLYRNIDPQKRSELARTLTPPGEVRFDAIRAVRCKVPSVNSEDVRSWQVLEEWRL